MAERSFRTQDVPNFDTYPAPESPTTDTEHQLPAQVSRRPREDFRAESPRLNEAAEEIGRTAGHAVAKIREFPKRVADAKDDVRDRLRVVRAKAEQKAGGRLSELKHFVECRLDILKSRASERVHLLRNRAERIQRENPVELIVGAFGAAFLLGAALRIWRSNRG